jgi:hypothetical protein
LNFVLNLASELWTCGGQIALPDGTTLPALADGEYDAIILGTGLKECIISGKILFRDPFPSLN